MPRQWHASRKKKPVPSQIRAAPPLSETLSRQAFVCICGRPAERLRVWREHDDRDRPIEGDAALIFIGNDHEECIRRMEDHPRLYAEETGRPGLFPSLCGPCTYRAADRCTHPDLKANGGKGLLVTINGGLPKNVIVCPPPQIVRRAEACKGREVV